MHFFPTVCVAACMLNRVIKNTMKRVNNNNSVDLLPRVLRAVWSSIQHFRRKWKKEETKKINNYPETRCGAISTCVKDILEKKWNKLCEMKEEIRKVVVGSDFFQETTKVTLMTLKLALEPLFFFFAFGVPSSEWQVEHLLLLWYLLWNYSNT